MNVFEPLFLVLVVITIGTLITAAVAALRGGRQRAGRILRRLGVGAALYFAVVIVVSIVSKPRLYRVGHFSPSLVVNWTTSSFGTCLNP